MDENGIHIVQMVGLLKAVLIFDPMGTRKKNLSAAKLPQSEEFKECRIGIIVSEWNEAITSLLLEDCLKTLRKSGVRMKHVFECRVPGSFELPGAAKMLVESRKLDAVICLGCIVKGETRHDEYISHAVSRGIMDLSLRYTIPFVFGVLTTENLEQAQQRAGGSHGNKGVEAAATALHMVQLRNRLRK